MFELIRLKNSSDEAFNPLMDLYTEAFPEEERRIISDLATLVEQESRMHFNVIRFDGELAGLCIYWNFGEFFYLEHLAVYAHLRNKKIGQQVLNWLEENLQGLRILEAEPADEEMAIRRVNYYKRNGYEVRKTDYIQPSYDGVRNPIPLWMMTSAESESLDAYIETIKNEVYYKNQK